MCSENLFQTQSRLAEMMIKMQNNTKQLNKKCEECDTSSKQKMSDSSTTDLRAFPRASDTHFR